MACRTQTQTAKNPRQSHQPAQTPCQSPRPCGILVGLYSPTDRRLWTNNTNTLRLKQHYRPIGKRAISSKPAKTSVKKNFTVYPCCPTPVVNCTWAMCAIIL